MISRHITKAGNCLSHLLVELGNNLPSQVTIVLGSVVTGIAMSVAGYVNLTWHDWLFVQPAQAIFLLFGIGGALGFLPGFLLTRTFFQERSKPVRAIWSFLSFALGIHLGCAVVFGLQYRIFYAHWHAQFPSLVWFFQFTFTSLAASYQYTVHARFIYFPLVWLIFLGLAVWFHRRA